MMMTIQEANCSATCEERVPIVHPQQARPARLQCQRNNLLLMGLDETAGKGGSKEF
jgi:hypothetical protein